MASKLCFFVAAATLHGSNVASGMIISRNHPLDVGKGEAIAGQSDQHGPSEEPFLGTNMLDRLIIVPEIKLMFCYVEKVGCKNFNDLFRYYRSRYDTCQADNHTWKRNTFEVHNFTLEDIMSAMKSKDWFKAVFYRDPLERFVAGWSSKCGGADKDGWQHCAEQFGRNTTPFEDTVKQVYQFDVQADQARLRSQHSVNWTSYDPHWMRQADFCGGLWKSLRYYDMVEKLERRTSREKVISMLDRVGVQPGSIPGFDRLFPLPEDNTWQNSSHNTDSERNLRNFFPEDKPWLVEALMRHYSSDYILFKTSPPDWAMDIVRNRLPWQLSGFRQPDQVVLDREEALPPEMVPPRIAVQMDAVMPAGNASNTILTGSNLSASSTSSMTTTTLNIS